MEEWLVASARFIYYYYYDSLYQLGGDLVEQSYTAAAYVQFMARMAF